MRIIIKQQVHLNLVDLYLFNVLKVKRFFFGNFVIADLIHIINESNYIFTK